MRKRVRLTESDLHRIVKESVKRVLRESIDGSHFDLDQTTSAYRLGGNKTHWIDYSNEDGSWDEDRYYEDFDNWWDSLTDKEKERIYSRMKKY